MTGVLGCCEDRTEAWVGGRGFKGQGWSFPTVRRGGPATPFPASSLEDRGLRLPSQPCLQPPSRASRFIPGAEKKPPRHGPRPAETAVGRSCCPHMGVYAAVQRDTHAVQAERQHHSGLARPYCVSRPGAIIPPRPGGDKATHIPPPDAPTAPGCVLPGGRHHLLVRGRGYPRQPWPCEWGPTWDWPWPHCRWLWILCWMRQRQPRGRHQAAVVGKCAHHTSHLSAHGLAWGPGDGPAFLSPRPLGPHF